MVASLLSDRARLTRRGSRIDEGIKSKKEYECCYEDRLDPDDHACKYQHAPVASASSPRDLLECTVYCRLSPILVERIAPYPRRFALIFLSCLAGVGLGLSLCGLTPMQSLLKHVFQKRMPSTFKRIQVDDARITADSTDDRRIQKEEEQYCNVKGPESISTTTTVSSNNSSPSIACPLASELHQLDHDVVNNADGGWRFIPPYLLPPLNQNSDSDTRQRGPFLFPRNAKDFFAVKRAGAIMQWEVEWQKHLDADPSAESRGPLVDYTTSVQYAYPNHSGLDDQMPSADVYPPLRPLSELLLAWDPKDDFLGPTVEEALFHFDYTKPHEMSLAERFRDSELPFKVTNVPELQSASTKWTEEYVAQQFAKPSAKVEDDRGKLVPTLTAAAHESVNHFFCFFTSQKWNVSHFGLPPTRINDWNYTQWARHAQYAQATHLSPYQPHFYWQSGVHALERHLVHPSNWSFIARDLPSFSSPNATFFVFRPDQQKGIQCRFGQLGVYAATHYDGGRNMVAVIRGAKRYILSPPRECSKLGIWPSKASPLYRHSSLNYAHYSLLSDPQASAAMSEAEKYWLRRAGLSRAVETVLKPGEVLYIPSHWFHTVISLQKSVQCNVRAGIDYEGHSVFGNRETVQKCQDDDW